MCDTFVARPGHTARSATLFAKNSDRERNEAQALEFFASADHAAGSPLRLTYLTIPQADRTHACLISRPFWMWGAEMGANDAGVVIGNEAVQSLVPPEPGKALIGMDLVRLGLERGGSAAEAVEVMIDLLERHGQGGDCGHLEPFHYHNSFMVADPAEAFVLETVGRWWAVERVGDSRAISNVLSIGSQKRDVSPGLQAHAERCGWLDADGGFDVAARLHDPAKEITTRGAERCARATALIEACHAGISPADAMRILRDHGAAAESDPRWSPAKIEGRTICMHGGGGDRRSQTVSSMVSELRPDWAVHWVTASSAPCLGVFKPVTFAGGPPAWGATFSDRFDPEVRWWRREVGHRAALSAYADYVSEFTPARNALEATFRAKIDEACDRGDVSAALRRTTDACWREADAFEAEWSKRATLMSRSNIQGDYAASWAALSGLANMPAAAQTW